MVWKFSRGRNSAPTLPHGLVSQGDDTESRVDAGEDTVAPAAAPRDVYGDDGGTRAFHEMRDAGPPGQFFR